MLTAIEVTETFSTHAGKTRLWVCRPPGVHPAIIQPVLADKALRVSDKTHQQNRVGAAELGDLTRYSLAGEDGMILVYHAQLKLAQDRTPRSEAYAFVLRATGAYRSIMFNRPVGEFTLLTHVSVQGRFDIIKPYELKARGIILPAHLLEACASIYAPRTPGLHRALTTRLLAQETAPRVQTKTVQVRDAEGRKHRVDMPHVRRAIDLD